MFENVSHRQICFPFISIAFSYELQLEKKFLKFFKKITKFEKPKKMVLANFGTVSLKFQRFVVKSEKMKIGKIN